MKKEQTLYIQALLKKKVSRPPVWIMRQAGRYLPDYLKLKEKYSFWERCETPELVAEITTMPIEQIKTDAAILFSDILVVPRAMGVEIDMILGKGPVLQKKIVTTSQINALDSQYAHEKLSFVYEGIKETNKHLPKNIPLIGFAGAPWTIFCYLIEGQGSKNWENAKQFCFRHEVEAKTLLQKITDATIQYLEQQVEAGVDAIQIFDSWGGILSPKDYFDFSFPYLEQICKALLTKIPVTVFAKGCFHSVSAFQAQKVHGFGLSWDVDPSQHLDETMKGICFQGNLDPNKLFCSQEIVKTETIKMLESFRGYNYIANLGHGILPKTPVKNVKIFVETVKSFEGKW